MALFLELDFFIKSCRHFIGILAWTWAIIVFCLSYLGRGNHYNHNNQNDHFGLAPRPPTFYQTVFLPVLKVLLVAPSASLAGPVPGPEPSAEPHHQAVLGYPWGQGVAGGAPGGFIYCAGCSPLNPQQLVLPSNVPLNRGIPQGISASGVLPPNQIPTEKQRNGLGTGGQEPGKGQKIWDDGSVPVQQMALHDDGRYSFSYDTADASRQEQRNLDGSVSGSYSYTDPTGKLIQVDYTAGPQGYNAYGENLPPQPVFQLPQPVRDTPEVQEAREKFLQAYANELARHQMDSDKAHTTTSTVAPSEVSSESPSNIVEKDEGVEATTMTSEASNDDGEVLPLSAQPQDDEPIHAADDAVVVSGKSESGHDDQENKAQIHGDEIVDDKADSIVISADQPVAVNRQINVGQNVNLPDPSYQITIPIGVGQDARLSVMSGGPQAGQKSGEGYNHPVQMPMPVMQQQDGQNQNMLKAPVQPYFYYVSVGGSPHYVSAPSIPGYNSPYPTSLQASLLNSIPLAAVHDTQIPNRGNNDMNMNNMNSQPAVNKPVFLDVQNSVQQEAQQPQPIPQNMNNMQQMQNMQNMQQWQVPQILTPQNLNQQSQNQGQMQMQQWNFPQFSNFQNNQNQGQMQNMNTQQWQFPQLSNFQQNQPNNNNMQMQNMQNMQQWQMPQQFPSLMNNNNNNQNQNQNQNQLNFNNQLVGQLVPIQLAPLGSHNNGGFSFGYIPGLILSNGGAVAPTTTTQQQNEGSQPSRPIQVPALSFNLPQQQLQQPQPMPQQDQPEQIQTPAPADNQAEIVLASK